MDSQTPECREDQSSTSYVLATIAPFGLACRRQAACAGNGALTCITASAIPGRDTMSDLLRPIVLSDFPSSCGKNYDFRRIISFKSFDRRTAWSNLLNTAARNAGDNHRRALLHRLVSGPLFL